MQSPAIPMFKLAVLPSASSVLVRLEGELDLATAPRLAGTVDELREAGWDAIALDLSGVEFVDSTGLRLVAVLQERARREGWRLELLGRCAAFERLLTVTGLGEWFARA